MYFEVVVPSIWEPILSYQWVDLWTRFISCLFSIILRWGISIYFNGLAIKCSCGCLPKSIFMNFPSRGWPEMDHGFPFRRTASHMNNRGKDRFELSLLTAHFRLLFGSW